MKTKILLLDDEESLIKWLKYALEQKDYSVVAATDPRDALAEIKNQRFDLVISDIKMPEMDGFGFLRKVRSLYPSIPFIFITAYGSMDSVISAMRDRASDYILKPFSVEELLVRIRSNISKPEAAAQKIIGVSKEINATLKILDKVAATDTTVLLLGESGTGKELFAREIHNRSKRATHDFVTISCAALPETLLESELFGYKRGAFTGATCDKEGLFRAASKGSFFLDEIGEATPAIQVKILRLLEEKEIVPLGSTKPVRVDVRLIAATNKNLAKEMEEGRFREDLYYRLNVVPLVLPPLRERRDDIPVLAKFFLQGICEREKLGIRELRKGALNQLLQYDWPGNIRELRHVIERAAILSDSQHIDVQHLGLPHIKRRSLTQLQSEEIERVVQGCGGNMSEAANILGVSRATLYRKLKQKRNRRKR
ncbi:MAG: sigma-54-dependent Fis family transcriptional regulator [candidate division WOR-3 bacterium]|nr:MAG: sigma-54-dependent Fis family transcriptional regulator [candidate division WOR-3 bacterium]